ncbi:hypothetical protein M8J75_006934 [Diaphorina citri]|nr:hypothetical protein M8J75_006934 [Diaphorina citri]
MTLEFSETNSGKILLSYEGYKYTYKHPLNKTGFAYKCFKPSCTAFLHLNKAKDTVTSQGGTHNHGRISSVSSVNTPPCTPPPTSQVPGNIQLISGGHRDPPVSTKSAGYQTDPSPLVSIESSCFIDRLADKERELMQARDKINSLQTTVELLGNANAAHSKMFADMEKNVMKKLDTRSSNSSTSSKPKILYSVYGDSHVRYIPNVISKQCDSLVSCNHYTKSGGVFSDISAILRHVDTPRKNDWAIVMCGCNDIQNYKWNQVKDSLDKIIDKFKTCKLCLVSIPYRYDKAHLNSKIRDVNKVIMDYVKSKNEKVRFLESTEVVIYDDYALDLLHLGPMGTDKICQKLIEIMTKPVESTSKSRTTSTHVPMKTKSNRRQVGHHTKVPEKRADAGAGQNTAPVPEKPKKRTRRRKPKHTPRNEQRREFMDSRRRDGGGGQRSTPATRPQLVFNTGSNLGSRPGNGPKNVSPVYVNYDYNNRNSPHRNKSFSRKSQGKNEVRSNRTRTHARKVSRIPYSHYGNQEGQYNSRPNHNVFSYPNLNLYDPYCYDPYNARPYPWVYYDYDYGWDCPPLMTNRFFY